MFQLLLLNCFVITIIGSGRFVVVNGQIETACIGVPDNNFVNNPMSCNHFYLCINETALPSNCPDTWYFHPITQFCDYPNNVDCEECSPFGIQHLPIEYNCEQFIRCENGELTLVNCPTSTNFNRKTGWCDNTTECIIPETTTTTTEPDPAPPTTEPPINDNDDDMSPNCRTTTQVFHTHPIDCSRYFLCINGFAIAAQCPNDLIWNQFINDCDLPDRVACIPLTISPIFHEYIMNLHDSIQRKRIF